MSLTLHALPALTDNYVWALVDAGGHALIVDPGEAAPVLDAATGGLRPVAILLTHHHHDHIGGVAALRERWPSIRCYGPEDRRIADDHVDVRVGDGDRVGIGSLGLDFDVISVPGHTRSHIAYHGHDHLFCGDTLFSLGCGRLFEGTPAQMLASLDRIAALADQWVCAAHEYTVDNARFARTADPDNGALERRQQQAHEQRARGQPTLPSRLAEERACNPFLNSGRRAIHDVLAARDGRPVEDRLDAFTRLRLWKDEFR